MRPQKKKKKSQIGEKKKRTASQYERIIDAYVRQLYFEKKSFCTDMALMDQQQIEPDAVKKVDSILGPQSDIPSECNLGEIIQRPDALQRHLTSRQIQFIAIGGSIGTALFVSIGYALMHGAASLLVAFILQACIMAQVNSSLAEMTIFMPVSAAFIQHASVWVDGAWGFMIGWNFCVFEGLLIPFEITALDMVLSFWRDDIPAAAVISACIVLYAYVLS